MTWTATERKGGMSGRIATDIVDEADQLICRLYAWADEPGSIEQTRARARLIVQAEAMRDALGKAATALDLTAEVLEEEGMTGTAEDVRNDALKARAIIAATEGDHG